MPNGKRVEDEASRKAKEELARNVRDKFDAYKKATGISQTELAAKIGVSQNTISSWLSPSKGGISGSNLMRLAKAMGVSMDYLAGIGEINEENAAEEITALKNFFDFSPSTDENGVEIWTLEISSPLLDYFRETRKIKLALAAGMPEEGAKYWYADAQEKYRTAKLNAPDSVHFFDVYPRGYIQEKERKLRLEYGRIPAPEAGDGNPVNRAKK